MQHNYHIGKIQTDFVELMKNDQISYCNKSFYKRRGFVFKN